MLDEKLADLFAQIIDVETRNEALIRDRDFDPKSAFSCLRGQAQNVDLNSIFEFLKNRKIRVGKKEVEELFAVLDLDQDALISEEEFLETVAPKKYLMARADSNIDTQDINLEFIEYALGKLLSEEVKAKYLIGRLILAMSILEPNFIDVCFSLIDVENRGSFSNENLLVFLKEHSKGNTISTCERAIRRIDLDKDGVVSKDDWIRWIDLNCKLDQKPQNLPSTNTNRSSASNVTFAQSEREKKENPLQQRRVQTEIKKSQITPTVHFDRPSNNTLRLNPERSIREERHLIREFEREEVITRHPQRSPAPRSEALIYSQSIGPAEEHIREGYEAMRRTIEFKDRDISKERQSEALIQHTNQHNEIVQRVVERRISPTPIQIKARENTIHSRSSKIDFNEERPIHGFVVKQDIIEYPTSYAVHTTRKFVSDTPRSKSQSRYAKVPSRASQDLGITPSSINHNTSQRDKSVSKKQSSYPMRQTFDQINEIRNLKHVSPESEMKRTRDRRGDIVARRQDRELSRSRGRTPEINRGDRLNQTRTRHQESNIWGNLELSSQIKSAGKRELTSNLSDHPSTHQYPKSLEKLSRSIVDQIGDEEMEQFCSMILGIYENFEEIQELSNQLFERFDFSPTDLFSMIKMIKLPQFLLSISLPGDLNLPKSFLSSFERFLYHISPLSESLVLNESLKLTNFTEYTLKTQSMIKSLLSALSSSTDYQITWNRKLSQTLGLISSLDEAELKDSLSKRTSGYIPSSSIPMLLAHLHLSQHL